MLVTGADESTACERETRLDSRRGSARSSHLIRTGNPLRQLLLRHGYCER
jgi:hypothetical protein